MRTSSVPLHPQLRSIGSLFSGIGGFDLGLEQAGCGSTIFQVELDPYCNRVLERHWPLAERHLDVRSVGKHNLPRVDILCGGFPCQDESLAGKRRGLDGERSGLWFEYRRVIEELAPRAVFIENVLGLRTSGLPRVLSDLAHLGFDAEWTCIPAAALGAPHLRRRIFIVATHPDRLRVWDEPGWLGRAHGKAAAEHRLDPAFSAVADADSLGRLEQSWRVARERGWSRHAGWELDHPTRMDDGFPEGMDVGGARKALGNAIVVPCARLAGSALIAAATPR